MTHRTKMAKAIVKTPFSPYFKVRKIDEFGKLEIAEIMYDCYIDTIDYENDTIDDFCMDILNIEDGLYGKYIPNASVAAEIEGKIAGGLFITNFKNEATITYNFTAKKYRNQGISTSLIQTVENILFDMGYENLYLYLSVENIQAYNLYVSLGFEEIESL